MQTNEVLVSIIVPVYNTEKYLERCIKSLVNQDYRNLQIILVDDGSRDNSGEMCDNWELKDNRITVIHKENGGLGYARNSGLELVKGKYISFVDSDDYIKNKTISSLVDKMESTNADVCYFGCDYDVNGRIIINQTSFPDKLFNSETIRSELLPISFGASIEKDGDLFGIGSVCCGFYRNDIFVDNNLLFQSERDVLCEDILFTSKMLLCARSVCFMNENFYIYFRNENSLTHTFRSDRFQKSLQFYDLQVKIIEDNNLNEISLLRAGYSLLINLMVCIRQEARTTQITYEEKKERIKKVLESNQLSSVLEEINFRRFNIKKKILFFCMKKKLANIVLLIGRG